MPLSTIKSTGIADSSVSSSNITDGSIVNADVNACAAIASSKISGVVANTEINTLEQNIALLGFKMAVNDGLTVFNLVDGVVDEFHDESGTDEGEGSNDTYCSSSDFYKNVSVSTTPYSAGFGYNHRTEPDTSNPGVNTYSVGIYTVPTGVTSLDVLAWGAGGGAGPSATTNPEEAAGGGGGGFAEGTFAVTAGQVLSVAIGQAGFPIHEPAEFAAGEGGKGFRGAGDAGGPVTGFGPSDAHGAGGGGASGLATAGPGLPSNEAFPAVTAPEIVLVAGGGGGGGFVQDPSPNTCRNGGGGGGLVGQAGGQTGTQTSNNGAGGGGGDQEQGGTGGSSVNPPPDGNPGGFLSGGNASSHPQDGDTNVGGGGEGYYGGGGGGKRQPTAGTDHRVGGGGSSYYGHPQITSGSTEAGVGNPTGGHPKHEGGGTGVTGYVSDYTEPTGNPGGANGVVGDGGDAQTSGERGGAGHGFVLINATGTVENTASTTIVSNAFTASSAPTTSRIVVFQEDLSGSPSGNLNTDIIASISRDGGSNFTTATLTDSGYVTGSSGQRILTGTATVSGQPSGTSMRWKLALANNQSKIHGVSLQWK
tara:strand:+ start:2254 stop:4023 length:1770 start_codon:yes stop_codon:yes gene_type:complete